ncbi:cell death abnormality protein 1-like [Mya arenaria]|uniref:cell death abnormality protein 1-like n=1 Tax=Mya arenaria TaxID=6604 RepID=UPI0022E5916A|nr:cell death abnormality protein 1-like [Mya arenaria]
MKLYTKVILKVKANMEIITLLCIIFLHVSPSFSQDCSPCFCCKHGTGCKNNVPLGIDNYCWEGCVDGFMSPQCQKPCVNQRCRICSTEATCDTCYDGYYGDLCQSLCPSTCTTCTSGTLCTSCRDGYYGDLCQSLCPSTCNTCTSGTLCTSCRDGHHSGSGLMCIYTCRAECLSCANGTSCTACKFRAGIGYYGNDCSNVCSNKCKDFLCDIYGNCLECDDPNFTGGNCDICIDGKYGIDCSRNCPVNCLSCVSETYCTACKDKFTEPSCCPENCYHDNCKIRRNGICVSCKDGFYGDYCNITCSENCMYGNCGQYQGDCKAGCKAGFYGDYCNKTCSENCKYATCDQYNGDCIKGCKQGLYGVICNMTCSSNCKNDICHQSSSGECVYGCDDGYYGVSCSLGCNNEDFECLICVSNNNDFISCRRCTEGFYPGANGRCIPCEPNCSGNCNQSNGSCIACPDGYHGTLCDNPCSNNCRQCHQNNRTCKICENQTWGDYCLWKCSSSCLIDTNSLSSCDIATGKCKFGCIAGNHGLYCERKCDQHCGASKDGIKVCRQEDGICAEGCSSDHTSTDGGCVPVTDALEGDKSSITAGAMGGVIALLIIVLAFSVGFNILLKKRNNIIQKDNPREINTTENEHKVEAQSYEQLQGRPDQPNYQNVTDSNYDMLCA